MAEERIKQDPKGSSNWEPGVKGTGRLLSVPLPNHRVICRK